MPNYQVDYPQVQDVSGLTPVFQNISAQQALHNQLMQQQNQQNQDAVNIGQSYGKGMSGLNPLAMATMLRNKKPNYDQWQTFGDNTYFGENSNGVGAGQNYSGMNAELGL
jgi:hypothetical protein